MGQLGRSIDEWGAASRRTSKAEGAYLDLERARELAESASRAKSQFLAMHEPRAAHRR